MQQLVSIRNTIMQQSAHIKSTHDGSLEERVNEYHSAQEAFNAALLSQHAKKDPDWSDTIGEQEDIDIAEEILKTSLSLAAGAIGLGEIADIIELGLMTEDEAHRLSKEKQKQDFEEKLRKQRQSQSDEDQKQI